MRIQVVYTCIFDIFGIAVLHFNLKEMQFVISYQTRKMMANIEDMLLISTRWYQVTYIFHPDNLLSWRKLEIPQYLSKFFNIMIRWISK